MSPLFQISPLFSKNFQTLWKVLKFLPFPKKFLDFHLPKCLMTFYSFSQRPKISNFPPIFPVYISPLCFAKIIISPYSENPPPVLEKFTWFLHILCVLCIFRFPPYFDHDAFMHHPMQVLDASDNTCI